MFSKLIRRASRRPCKRVLVAWWATPLVLTSQRRPLKTEACQHPVFTGLHRGESWQSFIQPARSYLVTSSSTTPCMARDPVALRKPTASTLILVAGCFCFNRNATSKAAANRAMPAMRNDPCSASTNASLIAWCSAAGGSGSRPGRGTWLACAPKLPILLAIAAPIGPGTPRCAS